MATTGYLQTPTIAGDTIVFVTEDDLWSVPAGGGIARRLTASLSSAQLPALSPDGQLLAFSSLEEGQPDVWCMPATGGTARRLTWLGSMTAVRGWTPDGRILFTSDAGQPFNGPSCAHMYAISADGGNPEQLPLGPAVHASWGPGGGVVIGRFTADPALWKRYRGGRTGALWVDARGNGAFRRLLSLNGNFSWPMWVGDRIFFVSDHEGIGNVYSVRPDGDDLRRHTDHDEYYARYASTDGARIVYTSGADVYVLDAANGAGARRVDIDLASPRTQRNRKFVSPTKNLFGFAVHPAGHSVAVETRGKLFTMPLWEQAVRQYGQPDGVRYRHARWVGDASGIVVVSDEGGDDALELHGPDGDVTRLSTLDLGCITEIATPPTGRLVAVANHRAELHVVDLDKRTGTVVDRSPAGILRNVVWSPDGKWLAYSFGSTSKRWAIKLCDVGTSTTHFATDGEFRDYAPSFDPDGKYLYFLSGRVFDPVYDALYFDLGFPKGVRPYLVTLSRDDVSPFIPTPHGLGPADDGGEPASDGDAKAAAKSKAKTKDTPGARLLIDFDGIERRIVAFPVPEGRYEKVVGIKGKALFLNLPVEGSLGHTPGADNESGNASLEVYDFTEQKHDTLIGGGLTDIEVSRDGHTLVYRAGDRLRAVKAGEKPPEGTDGEGPGRKSGWIDLERIKVSVDPGAEWRQMYNEAWRLQRDHFWVPDMSGVDWPRIRARYAPLVERVASRKEFSDLLWEMQGELGTSHAYEMGGDYRPPPPYRNGYLGADMHFDGKYWRVDRVVAGDVWDERAGSPLAGPGVNVSEGDMIVAINGRPVSAETPPAALLVNQAGVPIELTVADSRGRKKRTVVVTTMSDEFPARYREWVTDNRRRVHDATDGRVGYVHVPDMMPNGYAEFHRSYLTEVERDGLIVDVRFNRGGHVSSLVLEKLARRRVGYGVSRWYQPEAYPEDSPAGPLVAITNENAGSDGDIVSHCFKLFGLGPLVGKRTWGGVIGINPTHALADGTYTTQPEYAFWFSDVGWNVENYGTDPDYDIDIRPQDYVAGRDPQMDKAIELITRALRGHRMLVADTTRRPNLALPTLPPSVATGNGAKPKTRTKTKTKAAST